MQVGDCGPDQCGMRVQLAGDFKNKPKSLFFGFACLAHQTSLSECKVIALTDTICTKLWGLRFHYYSSLVKINHLFRSGTVAVGKSAKKHMDDVQELSARVFQHVRICGFLSSKNIVLQKLWISIFRTLW